MISYSEALDILEKHGLRNHEFAKVENVSLLDSLDRYVSNKIVALEDNPRFDNSAMDGYAVISAETTLASLQSPVRLRVLATLGAGEALSAKCFEPAGCIEIMTGAKLPDGPYDSVVRLEDVTCERSLTDEAQYITLKAPVAAGENIRYLGQDLKSGDLLCDAGTRIGPGHLLALSMSGVTNIEVLRRPKVVVISTGNELVPFDAEAISDKQIRNSTAPLLCSTLSGYGAEVQFLGIARDSFTEIEQKILEAIECRPALIITTGGVSVGKYDLVTEVVKHLQANIHFHKVAVRPGKPILFAEFPGRDTVFFGLPGNPIAVAATVRFFVYPYLRALMGQGRELPHRLMITEQVKKPEGLSFFQRGLRKENGVSVLPGQASFMVKALMAAEGWIVGASKGVSIEQGDLVDWYSLW